MSRVLLTTMPVHRDIDNPGMRTIPPMAMYLLASVLRENGYSVKTLDPSVIRKMESFNLPSEQFTSILKDALEGIDVVGISANTATWGVARLAAMEIARLRPEIPIVFGGVHANYFDKYILRTTPATFVIRGEGEVGLIELLEALDGKRKFEEVVGLTWKRSGEIIQNSSRPWQKFNEIEPLPLPAFDLLPEKVYYTMPIETSRGCRFSCRFCSVPRRSCWEGFDPEWVTNRITKLVKTYRNKFIEDTIYFVDDCFTVLGERAESILKGIEKASPESKLVMEARATDLLQPGLLEAIPKHMLIRLAIGVECGYDEGLKKIGKGLTVKELILCLEKIEKAELMKYTYFSFIIGFPWESEEECLKTVQFAANLVMEYGATVNLNWLFLLPSRLWFEREEFGIGIDESAFDDPLYIFDNKNFFITHPNISLESYNKIEKIIDSYKAIGCPLRSP